MYHPSRGGVRGGRDQFNWDDVKADKHRENYLGHSINAPVGRWQKGKDLHWYNRDKQSAEAVAKDEIKRIQEEEDEAMQEMLGLAPKKAVRRQNQLDDREVSELLKKGADEEGSTPSYAAGERVEGLGFAPAPPQTVSGQVAPERTKSRKSGAVIYEKISPALPSEETHNDVAEKEKGRAAGRDAERILDGHASVPVADEDGSNSSSSGGEYVSRSERREERRRTRLKKKEQRREEKRTRKQARLDAIAKGNYVEAGLDRQKERDVMAGRGRLEQNNSKGISGHSTKEREVENGSRSYGQAHQRRHRDGMEDGSYERGAKHHSSVERHERGGRLAGYRDADESRGKRDSARHNDSGRGRERGSRLRHDSSEERDDVRRPAKHNNREESTARGGRMRHDSSDESDGSRRPAKHDSGEESRARRGRVRHDSSESDDRRRPARVDSREESRAKRGRLRHDSSEESDDGRRKLAKYNSRAESRATRGRKRHGSSGESDDGGKLVKHDSREESRARRGRAIHDSSEESDDSRGRTGRNGTRLTEASQYKRDYGQRVQVQHGGRDENRRSDGRGAVGQEGTRTLLDHESTARGGSTRRREDY